MILIIVTDRLLRGEGLTTDALGRGTIAIVVIGVVTCQQRVHFDSLRDFPLSGVGDEKDVEDVRLLIVSVLEVCWVF